MSEDVKVDWPRVERAVRKMALALNGELPTTEACLAGAVFALYVAQLARPERTRAETADMVGFIVGNLMLEHREGRLPIKFTKETKRAANRK